MKFRLLFLLHFKVVTAFAQEGPVDTTARELEEVIVSYNKWEQQLNEIPNKVVKVSRNDIIRMNPQTSADLLAQTGTVFVQKSQLGGGSPMIRGFATNRILLVVDGVRMNNAIYRSGNLQNVISIDALSTETAEIVFGPGSLIYGSDAIGGVIDFHTLEPRFAKDGKTLTKANVLARYSTADGEKTIHGDVALGWKKWALVTSATFSSFDDLQMGKHGGQDRYLRPEFVERINGSDSIIQNSDPRTQRFSGYDQTNFLQKIAFRPTEGLQLQYSFVYGGTGIAPRYDRLIQYRNGALRFAEWNYGPMIWRMHTLRADFGKRTKLYDESKLVVAYQDYDESRIDRTRNRNQRNRQAEKVHAYSFNWDASKSLSKGTLYYGTEVVYNKVGSTGTTRDIVSGTEEPFVSRYPDGSTWATSGLYGNYKLNLRQKFTVNAGLRYSYNWLDARFSQQFIPFPYTKVSLNEGALTGNAGLVFRPAEGWQLNGSISTGYRMPNIDDIGKLFESAPGNITVPNPELGSEYAWNFEAGASRQVKNAYRVEVTAFHTILDNAIVRRPFTFNGQDSIEFDGEMSRVEALKNAAKATMWGIQAAVEVNLLPSLRFRTLANWITGKETDDAKDEQVPLRHAPPFYGSAYLLYTKGRFTAELNAIYNSEVSADDLAPSEKAKTDIYASDKAGNPYSPSWYTLNSRVSCQLNRIQVTVGWENITNQRYRPYSSGIVAAGSNMIIAIKAGF